MRRRITHCACTAAIVAALASLGRASGSGAPQGLTELHVLRGHKGRAFGVAATPDGRRALTTGLDGTLRIWDLTTGKELDVIQAHEKWAVGLAVGPGEMAVTSGNDNTARLWDLNARKEVRLFRGHEKYVWGVALSDDGRRLLTGSHDKSVRLWDVTTGRELNHYSCSNPIWGVALSPDGKRLLLPTRDAVALIDAAKEGDEGQILKVNPLGNQALAFSPDGQRALVGGGGGRLFYWDLASGKQLREFDGHARVGEFARQQVRCAAFSPDGRWAATTGYDTTVRLWDLEAGKELARYDWRSENPKEYMLFGVAFTPDGRRLLAAGGDGLVRVLQIDIEQTPAVGKHDAAPEVKVPNVDGMTAAQAKQVIEQAGLTASFELGKAAPNKERSLLAFQSSPPFGTAAPKSSEVRVTLFAESGNAGDQKETVHRVPDVDGMTAARAKQVIEQARLAATFELGRTAPSKDRSLLAFRSSPPAGSVVAKDSQVKVTLYAEAKAETNEGPQVTGKEIGTPPAPDKQGTIYRLDYVEVHRGFSLRSADQPKVLSPTKAETIKGRPGSIETSLTTYWYDHKAVLAVDAPETVVEGQEVTLTASLASTFDLKEESGQSQPYASVRIGLPEGDYQTTPEKSGLKPGRYTVKASKSVTVRFDEKDKAVLSFSRANGVRYAKFGVDARTSLSNQATFGVYWYYRADAPTPTPTPTPTPKQPSKVDIVVKGDATAGVPFALSATIHNPTPGQTARVELPAGLELVPGGQHVQPVPAPSAGGHTSVVTWQVKPVQPGNYHVKIDVGNGAIAPRIVTIAPPTPQPAPRLELSTPNTFSAGKPFTVSARVTNPAQNQELTLLLTPKLERTEGAERQIVPPGSEGAVEWKVTAAAPGQFTLRVRSGTGLEEERSITITASKRDFTVLDAQRALKMWVRLIDQEPEYDLDGNGIVDSNDAIRILDLATAREKRK